MEPSSPFHQPNSNLTVQTPSFLAHLPSRGFLSSSVVSTNPGGMRVYICEHDTSPPEGQEIKTNQMNILIRSLQIKKQKGDSSSKGGSRKRVLDRSLDTRASKRSGGQSGSRQEGSDNQTPDKDLYSLTVERLRALLKERGLSTRGRKDELVARLRSANG